MAGTTSSIYINVHHDLPDSAGQEVIWSLIKTFTNTLSETFDKGLQFSDVLDENGELTLRIPVPNEEEGDDAIPCLWNVLYPNGFYKRLIVGYSSETVEFADITETALSSLSGTELLALVNQFIRKTGGTMTGPLILNADPTDDLGAVTKQYADAIELGGGGVTDMNQLEGTEFSAGELVVWDGLNFTPTPVLSYYHNGTKYIITLDNLTTFTANGVELFYVHQNFLSLLKKLYVTDGIANAITNQTLQIRASGANGTVVLTADDKDILQAVASGSAGETGILIHQFDTDALTNVYHDNGALYLEGFPIGTAFNKNFGSSAGEVTQGNDSRLSDARTPLAHAASHTDGSDDIQDATAAQKGLATAAQITKLDGIESGATADQTGAEIKVAYEGEADTNAFTDAEKSKLGAIEAGATADLTGSEILALLLPVDGPSSLLDADRLDGMEAGAFATASHNHDASNINSGTFANARIAASNVTQHQASLTLAQSQITSLVTDLANKQPLATKLTNLAAMNSTAGLVEQTGTNSFAKRLLGVAAGTSIPTRADADARFAALVHTHLASSITDFAISVTSVAAVVANTAKVTNATHTGEVTGSSVLTVDSTAITNKTLVTAVGSDYVLIADASDSGNLKKALISDFASAGGDMSASVYDPTTVAGDAFDMDNMAEGSTNKILTAAERTLIASALQTDDINTLAEINAIIGDATLIDTNDSRLSDARLVIDADYGDITVSDSGTTWTIDDNAVTYAKMQDVSATSRLLGRVTAGAGIIEELTVAAAQSLLNVEDGATADMSGAEIKAAYEAEANTNAFTDAEQSKLASIESGAEVNDVVSVNSQTGVVVLDADNIDDSATANKFTTAADISKLAGIEANATADQTAADIKGLGFFDTSNDGAGSGLDADLLDGNHASAFATSSHTHTESDITDLGDYLPKDVGILSKSANYTIAAGDAGKIVECNGTFTITLPDSLDTGFQIVIVNVGTGTITIAASTTLQGVTSIATQYAAATAYHRGSNVWLAFGGS